MFRDKSGFEILEGFSSELMKDNIQILEILESESNKSKKKDKFNRVDTMIKNSKDELIIVEVQNNEEYDYLQRILYGTSKTIIENIAVGKTYAHVKKHFLSAWLILKLLKVTIIFTMVLQLLKAFTKMMSYYFLKNKLIYLESKNLKIYIPNII